MAINELIEGYVSRQEAIAKGLKFYFTGKPCKHGHVADRYVKNYGCMICKKQRQIADSKRWRENNKTKIKFFAKRYYENNRKQIAILNKTVYAERIKKYDNKYRKNRREIDINFRIAVNLRARLWSAVKNKQTFSSARKDLGCSIAYLKQYLKSQFQEGMTWENYGPIWHIDHIEPLCSFDLEDREQFLKAWHYTNLQPLFVKDNLKKKSEDMKKKFIKFEKNVWEDLFE